MQRAVAIARYLLRIALIHTVGVLLSSHRPLFPYPFNDARGAVLLGSIIRYDSFGIVLQLLDDI